jgi:transcriptional regulator with PAS, ATPase and Fis domain
MEAMTGFTAAEAIGRPCSLIKGDACFTQSCLNGDAPPCSLFQVGEIHGKRCHIERADGQVLTVVKSGRVVRAANGTLLGGVETVTDVSRLVNLEQEVARLRDAITAVDGRHGLVGRHPAMQDLYARIDTAARCGAAVLITGETGTGKELVAAAIHEASERRDGPFVRVSCAALPEGVLESELFGHVKGAFSGAVRDRTGRFEAAHGGTLFLDEIGELTASVQVKLLRVLQDHQFERVGSNRSIHADIRVIAATHRDLQAQVASGAFRADLYYRLAVFPIHVPPLRERLEDIPLLAGHFLHRGGANRTPPTVSPAAMARLASGSWPGNVRELEHAIAYAAAVAGDGPIEPWHLPGQPVAPPTSRVAAARRHAGRPSEDAIREALVRNQGNREATAAELGVTRMTLWRWLKALDLDPDALVDGG